jgi:isopenicillin-N epimerase
LNSPHPNPPFGHAMLQHWAFDPNITYLNHGTVGATPKPVLEVQQRLRDEMERQPSRFMLREWMPQAGNPLPGKPRVREAADAVAAFLGASGDDVVFVDNATAGANAVLRSVQLKPGDEVVILELAYGAVINTAFYVARQQNAKLIRIELPTSLNSPEQVVDAVSGALSPRTRLAVIDHITSESALVMPIAEIVSRCHSKGVLVLADGAHVPGAIPLNIPAIGADWYIANLHKWAYAPRGCGILWCARSLQKYLHPAVISHGLDKGYLAEFDWVGTKDPTPFLAAPAGIEFLQRMDVAAVQQYNHELAWNGAQMLCERFGTRLEVPEEMIGTMATLPLPERLGSTKQESLDLRDFLLFEENIEAQIHPWRGRLWMRISAQIYNEMADLERFASAVEKRM